MIPDCWAPACAVFSGALPMLPQQDQVGFVVFVVIGGGKVASPLLVLVAGSLFSEMFSSGILSLPMKALLQHPPIQTMQDTPLFRGLCRAGWRLQKGNGPSTGSMTVLELNPDRFLALEGIVSRDAVLGIFRWRGTHRWRDSTLH